jgi:argininosuccinate lyase
MGDERGVQLHELPLVEIQSAHPHFGDDVYEALSAEASVARREVYGATGRAALEVQLKNARAAILQP